MLETAETNQTLMRVANELIEEKDRVVGELSSLKVSMAAKDIELKKALDENERINERLRLLTDQMGTIRASAVEEFKSSEAYDDNNTKYFITGFELLRKQAKEKYPNLDFDVLQPYEDDESVMPANDGTTSADPQLDEDATT